MPFSTLLSYVEKYSHPEVVDINYPWLVYRAKLHPADDPGMQVFRAELTRLLHGDREGLPTIGSSERLADVALRADAKN